MRRSLPELPEARKARFVAQHGLPAYDAGILTSDRELADYFEACLQTFPHPKPVSNWIMGALLALLNAQGVSIGQAPIPAAALAGLLQLVDTGAISAKTAKTVFDEMAASGKSAQAIVAAKGLSQISDTGAIETVIQNVLAGNPKEVESYRGGKTKLMGFFVGEVMKATRGQANPKTVNELSGSCLEIRTVSKRDRILPGPLAGGGNSLDGSPPKRRSACFSGSYGRGGLKKFDRILNTLVGDHMKKLKTAVLSVLLLALSTSVFAAAKTATVAIVPFKVNAEKDMSFLRDGVYDMLSTRLTKEGEVEVLNRQTVEKALPAHRGPLTEAAGRELGRKLAADYVLFGSLTVLGNSISLDAKMVDVAGAKPTMSFFEQSEDAGGIISRINAMAADVNEKMFGRTTATAQPAPAAAAAPNPNPRQRNPHRRTRSPIPRKCSSSRPGSAGDRGLRSPHPRKARVSFRPSSGKAPPTSWPSTGSPWGMWTATGKSKRSSSPRTRSSSTATSSSASTKSPNMRKAARVSTSASMWPTSTATASPKSSSPA